jgi:hypothetical protein
MLSPDAFSVCVYVCVCGGGGGGISVSVPNGGWRIEIDVPPRGGGWLQLSNSFVCHKYQKRQILHSTEFLVMFRTTSISKQTRLHETIISIYLQEIA